MIVITKITDEKLLIKACESTFNGTSKQTLLKQYRSEESPARTQMFWIEIDPLPLFVSTHLLRHHVGSQPYALTHRTHRKCGKDNGRETPTKLSLLINAQSLIDMSKLRLCKSASKETRQIMSQIKYEVSKIDNILAKFMQPKCIYRNGLCEKNCKYYEKEGKYELINYKKMFM